MESNSISSSSSNSSSISEISSFSMNSSPNSRALFEEPKVRDYKIENEQLRNKITTDFISSDQVFLKRKQYICSACAAKISLVGKIKINIISPL